MKKSAKQIREELDNRINELSNKVHSLEIEKRNLLEKLDDTECLLKPLASENVELRFANERLFGYWHEVNKLTLELEVKQCLVIKGFKLANNNFELLKDKCNDNIRLHNDKKKLEKDIEFNNEIFYARENNYKDLITELKEKIKNKNISLIISWITSIFLMIIMSLITKH